MQNKIQALNKPRLFTKDKFRKFWNYKNKKLTIAFIINWTIIALIAVILIIIVGLDLNLYFKRAFATEYLESNYFFSLSDAPDWVIKDMFPDYIIKETLWLRIVLSLCMVFALYLIASNITLFSIKYYLNKKHNKNN